MSIRPGRAQPRSIRLAAYLAMFFGTIGTFAGVSGAATYIPYRIPDALSLTTAEVLTAISALGAALSGIGIVAGWRLLRSRAAAWEMSLGVAAGCVAAVAALALAMPAASPSPVPGGPGVAVLLLVVSVAYGTEALLLLLGRRGYDARRADVALGPRSDQPA